MPGPQFGSASGKYKTAPLSSKGESDRDVPKSKPFRSALVLSTMGWFGKPVPDWEGVGETEAVRVKVCVRERVCVGLLEMVGVTDGVCDCDADDVAEGVPTDDDV